jgi:hypothetical protein
MNYSQSSEEREEFKLDSQSKNIWLLGRTRRCQCVCVPETGTKEILKFFFTHWNTFLKLYKPEHL